MCYLKSHEQEFAELLERKTEMDSEYKSHLRQKNLLEKENRCLKIDRLFEKIYEDNINGKISDERFMKLSHNYEEEQKQLKKEIAALKQECEKEANRKYARNQFLKAVRKFMEMEKLTPVILKELVERIDVYHIQGTGKNRTQRIVIHYNFIGVLDMPVMGEYSENIVLDSRQGVAVEYLVG